MATRKSKYGVDPTILQELWEEQEGRCGVPMCREPFESIETAHVDHNHETGGVRGLLCGRCNLLEGRLRTAGRDLVEALFEWGMRPGVVYNRRKKRLTEEDRRIILENPEKKRMEDLAVQFGYSASRIRRIRKEALMTQSREPALPEEPSRT